MHRVLASALLVLIAFTPAARATVSVAIDLSHQRMHVVSAEGRYDWPISSARAGFSTPGGSYAPIRLERMHYSHKYHMSPMPYAIFFRGGYAIHGTYAVGDLGRPASHGCVRLAPAHAATLFSLVKQEGAKIAISGVPPQSGGVGVAAAIRRRAAHPTAADDVADDRRAARAERRWQIENAYSAMGYHYVGRFGGHNVYAADPARFDMRRAPASPFPATPFD